MGRCCRRWCESAAGLRPGTCRSGNASCRINRSVSFCTPGCPHLSPVPISFPLLPVCSRCDLNGMLDVDCYAIGRALLLMLDICLDMSGLTRRPRSHVLRPESFFPQVWWGLMLTSVTWTLSEAGGASAKHIDEHPETARMTFHLMNGHNM